MAETIEFEPAAMSFADQYKLLTGTVIPRPIGLVVTLGTDGANAAPFSFFNAVAASPPMVMFSIGPRTEGVKDTLVNLRHIPEFVVHLVDEAAKDGMNVCAVDHAPGVDEIALASFRTASSRKVRPPRIIDCPVQYECRVERIIELGSVPYHLVIGEVLHMHYRPGIVNERLHVNLDRLGTIGRLSGAGVYCRINDRFTMPALPRPSST
jgi:flavin reductase (DIM6/NTAB) family NADH-FMN oxidoreductase RutF